MNDKARQIFTPRGMSGRQAAAYWGVSPGTFKKMVELGIAPPPMQLRGIDRRVYDRHAIDRAMNAHGADSAAEDETSEELRKLL
jgi:hypothetical protein